MLDNETIYCLGLMAIFLGLFWVSTRGLTIKCRALDHERRRTDFFRVYNEMEDRTETLFDRRENTETDITKR